LRSTVGKTIGVLALFREDFGELFTERDARLTGILARKAVGIIEISYDALCGLYNRPAFERRLWLVVPATRGLRHWTALYIDLDRLHIINDGFGMHVGDSVLGKLGELIRLRLPPGALAARISGDRFAVALPTELDTAAQFAEALREGAEQLGASHDGSRLDVSLSIGVAPLDTEAGELMHSLAAAETACKAAKDRGRNRVEVYESGDASLVRRFTDIKVLGQLRTAIDEGRLWLAAQLILPFAGAESQRPHFELLLRMIDGDGNSVGPDRFLSAANRYQLMPEIDRWVMNKAIEMLKPHAQLLVPHSMSFAINFSGQSLKDEEFVDFVIERIGSSGLDPALFCFELTESAAIANVARAETLMRKLRQLGCGVALDDFGTGLSSLAYLRQLPVTMLKIDAQLLVPHSMSFAINFSGQSLKDEEFVDFVIERIGSSGLDPALFCFELTESAAIANVARAETLMRKLRQLGCGVALDDFGTGLSSLAYLRQLPVTMLKIDGSFVRDVLKDPRAESMVGAIAQLARSLSLTTVAEYVETAEIATRVAALGVDYGQGYAIGKPRPLIDVLAELPLLGAAAPAPRVAGELALEPAEKIVH
ncbi:MAG: EAL domain-containing protein, partial [Gammaproteobacteria bacterium]